MYNFLFKSRLSVFTLSACLITAAGTQTFINGYYLTGSVIVGLGLIMMLLHPSEPQPLTAEIIGRGNLVQANIARIRQAHRDSVPPASSGYPGYAHLRQPTSPYLTSDDIAKLLPPEWESAMTGDIAPVPDSFLKATKGKGGC